MVTRGGDVFSGMPSSRSDEDHPVGTLVIRVWYDGDPALVKARFVGRFDVVADRGPTSREPPQYATGLDDVAAKTRDWLEYFLSLAPP